MLEITAKTSRHDEAAAYTDSRPAGFSHKVVKREFAKHDTYIIQENRRKSKARKKVKKNLQKRLTSKENYAKMNTETKKSHKKHRKRAEHMRTYYIYNAETDNEEFLGTVTAGSIISAELKASKELNTTCSVYALTTAPGEPLA